MQVPAQWPILPQSMWKRYATPRPSPAKTGHCMVSEVPSCFTEILSSLDYSTLNSPMKRARHVGIQEWMNDPNPPTVLLLLMYYQNVLFLSTFLILIPEALVLFLGWCLPTWFSTFLWITVLLSYYSLKSKQKEKKKQRCLSPGKERLDTMPDPVQVSIAASPLSGAHTFWQRFCCHLYAAL